MVLQIGNAPFYFDFIKLAIVNLSRHRVIWIRVVMKKLRLSASVGYLVWGIWLGSSSLDGATAQSASWAYPLKLAQSQPPSSNTPRSDADSSGIEVKSSVTPAPISPACPFPPIPMSNSASNPLFGELTIGPPEITYGDVFEPGDGSDGDLGMNVNNLVSKGKLDEALKVAQEIKDVSRKNEALHQIASAYKEAGQLDQALEVAKSITELPHSDDTSADDPISLRDNVFSEIAAAYVKAGQVDKALQIEEIMGKSFGFSILLDIAEKYRVAGQPDRAAEVIDRAFAAYRTAVETYSSDPVVAAYLKLLVLWRFANEYAVVGRKNQAAQISSEIFDVAKTLPQQDFMTLSVLSGTAEVYTVVGQKDKAAEVLSYLLETAKNIEETFAKALALATIANGYTVLQQPARATELLSQALDLAKSEKGVSEKNFVLIMIARTYGVLGQYDKALQVTNAVEPASLQDQVKQTLACSREAG
jgi:tetratricopeptide (TPR) repeat protein